MFICVTAYAQKALLLLLLLLLLLFLTENQMTLFSQPYWLKVEVYIYIALTEIYKDTQSL